MTRIRRRLTTRLRALGRRILAQKDTPRSIALGFSLGVFISMSPLLGLHIVLALVLATALRCNRVAALAGVSVTNPFTLVPVFGFLYWVGAKILGQKVRLDLLREALATEGFWQSIWVLVTGVGRDLLVPLSVGGTLVGLASAILVYPVTIRIIEAERRILQRRTRLRAGSTDSSGD